MCIVVLAAKVTIIKALSVITVNETKIIPVKRSIYFLSG